MSMEKIRWRELIKNIGIGLNNIKIEIMKAFLKVIISILNNGK